MAKFLNKKEQVIDFKLTDYGHYLLSIGKMKPVYYAFFDENVLYDGEYAGITGSQNSIHERIKNETPYLEGLTHFTNIDTEILKASDASQQDSKVAVHEDAQGRQSKFYFASDLTPIMREPKVENLKASSMIGDAALNGEAQSAPAWKIVSLRGQISSSSEIDARNDIRIPQLDIQLNYVKKVVNTAIELDPVDLEELEDNTTGFSDGKMIQLILDNLMIYAEEANTELFTENFDIEVFKVVPNGGPWIPHKDGNAYTGSYSDGYDRKYFEKKAPQVVNNLLISPRPIVNSLQKLTTGSVEYYFDIERDKAIDPAIACKSAEIFNRSSYYIDLDFDCDAEDPEDFNILDIYGKITESEICPT
tara:strand:+ start:228 stop:1313 length:1086 start_codon:yes stop_codon:yes gene_type:complete